MAKLFIRNQSYINLRVDQLDKTRLARFVSLWKLRFHTFCERRLKLQTRMVYKLNKLPLRTKRQSAGLNGYQKQIYTRLKTYLDK
jgi:hypothetical protein